MTTIQPGTEKVRNCHDTDPYAPFLLDMNADVHYLALGKSTLATFDRTLDADNVSAEASQGCFEKTKITFTETDPEQQSTYAQNVGVVLLDKPCMSNFAKRFHDTFKGKALDQSYQADLSALRDLLTSGERPSKIIVPVPEKMANTFGIIFGDIIPGEKEKTLYPNEAWQKYQGLDVYRVELDFSATGDCGAQNRALYRFMTYVNARINRDSMPVGGTKDDNFCSQTLTPELVAEEVESVDLLNLYYFAVKRLQEETQAVSKSMTVQKVLAPETQNGLSEIPSDWFDFYARTTRIPAILNAGEYQSLLDYSGDEKISYERLAEMSDTDGYSMSWLERFMHSLEPQDKAEVASALQHFQNETWFATFTMDLGSGGMTPVSVFVDAQTKLCVISFEHDGRQIKIESVNDGKKHDYLGCTADFEYTDYELSFKTSWILKAIALQFKTNNEIPKYCQEILDAEIDYDADLGHLFS